MVLCNIYCIKIKHEVERNHPNFFNMQMYVLTQLTSCAKLVKTQLFTIKFIYFKFEEKNIRVKWSSCHYAIKMNQIISQKWYKT